MKLERSIKQIIIHCSDTPNGRWTSVDDIDRWHKERKFRRASKWRKKQNSLLGHIGYHFVVYTNGAVPTGRHINEVGAHAKGFNANSLGICLIGRDKFSRDQWLSLKSIVSGLRQHLQRFNVQVIGHRDVNEHKTCPNFDVAAWLENGMQPIEDQLYQPNEGNKS